jgi:hypothetical protein
MEENTIYIKISPEVLLTNDTTVTYSGGTAQVFSSMTQMLSGGTNGSSLYTGMTLSVYLNQNFEDIGYYSTWDGDIIQKEILNNLPTPIVTVEEISKGLSNKAKVRQRATL